MYVSLKTDDFAISYLDSVHYKTDLGEITSYFRKLLLEMLNFIKITKYRLLG